MKKYILFCVMMAALVVVGCTKAPIIEETTTTDQSTETVEEPSDEVTGASTSNWSDSEDTIEALTRDIEILGKEGFAPAEATVKAGEEVVFMNKADKNVVITFHKEGSGTYINTKVIKTGMTYSQVFNEAGTYTYWTIGYGVKGKLIVE